MGRHIDKITVRNIMRRHHIDPAPKRRQAGTSWSKCIKMHWDVLASTDFFTMEPMRTDAVMYQAIYEGWPALVEVLEEHGADLSLSGDASSPLDIFPVDLQHRLWLQTCFEAFVGLGQAEDLTLANEDQQHRVEEFISFLRDHKGTVEYFHLTLETLLTRVIMPPQDEEVFVRMMMEQLGLTSPREPLAPVL